MHGPDPAQDRWASGALGQITPHAFLEALPFNAIIVDRAAVVVALNGRAAVHRLQCGNRSRPPRRGLATRVPGTG